ncbi:unnamed protein product [Hydatigera taeniaeformis]|uniref:Uncharacterized protein n=1 Tax=Hydatigena taeniaeformis TaxID=6205 RepID=A0A3P7FUK4_HYDTA|nr:unnamed protein product [Hydatigera taeniaeformis]
MMNLGDTNQQLLQMQQAALLQQQQQQQQQLHQRIASVNATAAMGPPGNPYFQVCYLPRSGVTLALTALWPLSNVLPFLPFLATLPIYTSLDHVVWEKSKHLPPAPTSHAILHPFSILLFASPSILLIRPSPKHLS